MKPNYPKKIAKYLKKKHDAIAVYWDTEMVSVYTIVHFKLLTRDLKVLRGFVNALDIEEHLYGAKDWYIRWSCPENREKALDYEKTNKWGMYNLVKYIEGELREETSKRLRQIFIYSVLQQNKEHKKLDQEMVSSLEKELEDFTPPECTPLESV